MKKAFCFVLLGLLVLVAGSAVGGEKERPKIVPITPVAPGLHFSRLFNDHMVLQREKPVKIWGCAGTGEQVTVRFAGQTQTATADADGRWVARLNPMPASGEGRELVACTGASHAAIKDVLVGEVWLLGGQSNMSMPLWVRADGFSKADAEAHPEYGTIRCVTTLKAGFADPPYSKLDWIQKEPQKELPFKRPWVVFGPDCLELHAPDFSAFGFHFAKRLYDQFKVPIGLIDTSVGGTLAHYWAPGEVQQDIRGLEESYKSEFWFPGCLYNTTIWPIRDMSFRGVFFYLGENNSMTKPLSIFEATYRAVIAAWRKTFAMPDMPFGVVQISWTGGNKNLYAPGPHNLVQEALFRIHRTTPNTGLVVTADEGWGDLHVLKKQDHGERAVRWAIAEVYAKSLPPDQKAKTWGSPVFKSAKAKDNKLMIHFETMGGEGLKLKGEPAGFVVAGEDKKFCEAKAELMDKTTIAVWSDKVAKPVAARFAWSNSPHLNLWTEGGLPVSPFRTDAWE